MAIERSYRRTVYVAAIAGAIAVVLLFAGQSSDGFREVFAQAEGPGFSLSPVGQAVPLGGEQEIDVVVGSYDLTPVDTLMVTVEFDPVRVIPRTASCLGDLAHMQPTSFVVVKPGIASFTCFGSEVAAVDGIVASFLIAGIGVGDVELGLIADRPFSTGLIHGGTLVGQGQLNGGETSVDDGPSVIRTASALFVDPGQEVTVTLSPDGNSSFYAVREDLGVLELVSHTADELDSGVFVMISPVPFEYVVRVPNEAETGDQFPLHGDWWENPGDEFLVLPGSLALTVGEEPPTPTPTATAIATAIPPSPTPTTTSGSGGAPPQAQPTNTPISQFAPFPPRNVAAVPGDSVITLTWDEPQSDGGSPITGYRILNLASGSPKVVLGSARSFVASNLTNGVPYSFQVSAQNVIGSSDSVSIGPVTPMSSQTDEEAVEEAAMGAFGEGVEITSSDPEISTDETGIKALIPATGIDDGEAPAGGFHVETDKLKVDTDETGVGTGSLKLNDETTVTGDVVVSGSGDGIEVEFQQAILEFKPVIDDIELALMDDSVGRPQVSFGVDVSRVQQSSSVTASFSDEIPDAIDGSVFVFGTSGESGTLDDPDADIAYVVTVSKSDLADEGLHDNTVMMTVGQDWYENRQAAGKVFVITKISDDGEVFVIEPNCMSVDDTYLCTATFEGEAGGFSEFVLAALTPIETPTPTSSPISTPTPWPVPTSTTVTSTVTATVSAPTPVPTFGAPGDQPTQEASPMASPISSGPTPTPVPAVTVTPVPQPVDTPVIGTQGGRGGGVPVWILTIAGIVTAVILGGIIARAFAPRLSRQGK